jgi:hypothetical protein
MYSYVNEIYHIIYILFISLNCMLFMQLPVAIHALHPVSSTNETDHHDIAEIFLKVALNTIKQTKFLKHILSTKIDIYILLVFLII